MCIMQSSGFVHNYCETIYCSATAVTWQSHTTCSLQVVALSSIVSEAFNRPQLFSVLVYFHLEQLDVGSGLFI